MVDEKLYPNYLQLWPSQESKQIVVFDLFNTLLDEASVYTEFYSYASGRHTISLEVQEFVSRFFQYRREPVFADTKKPYKELVRLAYQRLVEGGDEEDLEILFDMYRSMDFLPGIKEMLAGLRGKFRFFGLTNCDNDLIGRIDIPSKSPVIFEKIFTSEENGIYKPNHGAYQKVVDYIGLPAGRVIYASSHQWDLTASREFGFNSKTLEELVRL